MGGVREACVGCAGCVCGVWGGYGGRKERVSLAPLAPDTLVNPDTCLGSKFVKRKIYFERYLRN